MTSASGVYSSDLCNGYQQDNTVKGLPSKIKTFEFGGCERWPAIEKALPYVPGQPGIIRGPNDLMQCVNRCRITLEDGTVSKELVLKVFDAYSLYKLAGSKRVQGSISLVDLEEEVRKEDDRHSLIDIDDVSTARQAVQIYAYLFPQHFADKKIVIRNFVDEKLSITIAKR